MNIVCLDFETRFDDNYTLKKLTTEGYIRDPRFAALGCAIRDQQRRWIDHEEYEPHTAWIGADDLRRTFEEYDWANTAVVCHHAQFDCFILSHHYGVRPKFIFDTLSMARLVCGNHLSVGLDSLAKHFGLAAKNVPYNLFKGRTWAELSPDVQRAVAAGACHDVSLTWQLFAKLKEQFPDSEYEVIDSTVRFFTEPVLRGDIDLLAKVWEDEENAKALRLEQLNISAADLASAERFAGLLRAEGVDPEKKPGKNGDIYAFAKTDEFMRGLLEHDNERVRTLAEARLGEKSTLLQTRAETLGWMARRGPMPVYLKMYGAHTTRWSGGDGCLTGDTKVVTFDMQKEPIEKRITDVLLDDLVWDGEEFVAHEGVIFQGYAEVIEHDGVKGTPDHKVYVASGATTLGEARKHNMALRDCPKPK